MFQANPAFRARIGVRGAPPGGPAMRGSECGTGRVWSSRADAAASRGRASGTTASSAAAGQQAARPRSSRQITFGKCETCKKPLGNPLTHVCKPKSDFKARKSRAAKKAKARRAGQGPQETAGRAAPVRVVPRRPVQAPSVRGLQDRMARRAFQGIRRRVRGRVRCRARGRVRGWPGIVPRPARERIGGAPCSSW